MEVKPDLVTMDVVMPDGDGIAATRQIMRERPTPIAIVTARPVGPGSPTTFQALAAGAVDVLTKPQGDVSAESEAGKAFLRELRSIAGVVVSLRRRAPSDDTEPRVLLTPIPEPMNLPTGGDLAVIGVGASTGGPPCIRALLEPLRGTDTPPIVVVQHLARHFVDGFASWLSGCVELDVSLAREGSKLRRGAVVVAPPDRHVSIDADLRVRLSEGPKVHGHRPAIDPLFESLAKEHGSKAAGILLTGIGEDGARGLQALREAGAVTAAQDEASSLVYGMPRAAANLNAALIVASPANIGRLFSRTDNLLATLRSSQGLSKPSDF